MTFLRKLGVLRVDRDHSQAFIACSPTVLTWWVELHAVSGFLTHSLTAQKVRAAGSAFYRLFLEIRLLSRAGSSVDWVEMSNRNFKLTHTFLASSTIIRVEGTCPEKNHRALRSVSATVLLHDSSLAFLWKPDDLFFLLQCPLRGQHLQASKT